jgi:hypothetical protein
MDMIQSNFFDRLARPAKAKIVKPSKRRGRPVDIIDCKISKAVRKNPWRKGSSGEKSWDLLETGMTVRQFLEVGGKMRDLRTDIAKERVRVR